MKKALAIAALFTVPLFLASCASTRSTVVAPVAFHEEAPREKDEVIIYVYRLPSFVGSAALWKAKLDGRPVGVLRQNAYVPVHASPGAHTVTVGENPILVRGVSGPILDAVARKQGAFNAATNGVYFIRCAGFSREFVSKEKAMQEINPHGVLSVKGLVLTFALRVRRFGGCPRWRLWLGFCSLAALRAS